MEFRTASNTDGWGAGAVGGTGTFTTGATTVGGVLVAGTVLMMVMTLGAGAGVTTGT